MARCFLSRAANDEGGPTEEFSPDALKTLCALDFPGNVREVKNLVHRAYVMSEGPVITREDIEMSTGGWTAAPSASHEIFHDSVELATFIETMERRYIEVQLEKHACSLTETARALGVQATWRIFPKCLSPPPSPSSRSASQHSSSCCSSSSQRPTDAMRAEDGGSHFPRDGRG
jgi:transcriptional regulator with PAS, ATPase and Fis domain